MSTNHNFRKERRAEAVSNRGPSAYQPTALPLGQTGSHLSNIFFFIVALHFTSTEVRWLIRDGDRVGRGRQSEGSTAETARKRQERPWTAARTMEVLRRCPLAIAQRLVHCAIAVSTAVLGQSHKDNVRCTAVDEQLGQLEAKDVQLAQPSSTSLLMISSGLTWRSSSTSLL